MKVCSKEFHPHRDGIQSVKILGRIPFSEKSVSLFSGFAIFVLCPFSRTVEKMTFEIGFQSAEKKGLGDPRQNFGKENGIQLPVPFF